VPVAFTVSVPVPLLKVPLLCTLTVADDVVADLSAAGGDVRRGVDAFVEFVRGLTLVQSVHQGHMPEIELTSPTTATGIWSLEDFNRWQNGKDTHGYGHYHETYEKVDGQWRIKTMRLTYLRMDVTTSTIAPWS